MAVARAKGRLKGRKPKLSNKQRAELRRMHATGNYTITDLAELFNISRPTSTAPSQPWKLFLHNPAADKASTYFALAHRPPNEKGPDPLRC